jgi:hypothetical protein
MAIYRLPIDYGVGTLTNAAAIGDTSLVSADFAALAGSGFYSASAVLPIVIHNPSTKAHEVVWVTAHTAASTTVTVVRGKEGTSAQAWPAGTQWVCAPTAARDGLGVYTSAQIAAMTDQHVGMSILEIDTGKLKTSTYGSGWGPTVGIAQPTDIGQNRSGTSISAQAAVTVRSAYVSGTTNGSGDISATFATPFPNGCQTAFACVADAGIWFGVVSVSTESATGLTMHCADISPFAAHASGAVRLFYIAIGY